MQLDAAEQLEQRRLDSDSELLTAEVGASLIL